MYAMIIGQYPFDGPTREKIKENIINKEVNFDYKKKLQIAKKSNSVKADQIATAANRNRFL